MKILVCIKHVPDTSAQIKISPDGSSMDLKDIEYIVSPYDEVASEKAVLLKEASAGQHEVVIVSHGTEEVTKSIRSCLAMTADRGILLNETQNKDPYAVASALAKLIQDEKPDLVLFGWKAYGQDYAQVPGIVSHILEWPLLSTAIQMELKDGKVKIESEIEGGREVVETSLPCIVSVQKGLAEPRIRSLKEVRAARKKDVATKEPLKLDNALVNVKFEYPPKRPMGKIVGEGAGAVPTLVKLLREEAKVI